MAIKLLSFKEMSEMYDYAQSKRATYDVDTDGYNWYDSIMNQLDDLRRFQLEDATENLAPDILSNKFTERNRALYKMAKDIELQDSLRKQRQEENKDKEA